MSSAKNNSLILPEGWAKPLCITLIGMAAAGKSTIGKSLAERLSWILIDTDRLIEGYFGLELQELKDQKGLEGFLHAEEEVVAGLALNRCVISTGGSVVYRVRAMQNLKSLGPVVFLNASLSLIRSRLRDIHSRGLAIRPGQSIESLYNERQPLYERYADLTIPTNGLSAETVAERIIKTLKDRIQEADHVQTRE